MLVAEINPNRMITCDLNMGLSVAFLMNDSTLCIDSLDKVIMIFFLLFQPERVSAEGVRQRKRS